MKIYKICVLVLLIILVGCAKKENEVVITPLNYIYRGIRFESQEPSFDDMNEFNHASVSELMLKGLVFMDSHPESTKNNLLSLLNNPEVEKFLITERSLSPWSEEMTVAVERILFGPHGYYQDENVNLPYFNFYHSLDQSGYDRENVYSLETYAVIHARVNFYLSLMEDGTENPDLSFMVRYTSNYYRDMLESKRP